MRGLADGPDPEEEGEAEHAESAGSKVAEKEMAEVLPAETQRRAQAAAHAAIAVAAQLDHVHLGRVEPQPKSDRDQQQDDEREREAKVIGGLDIFFVRVLEIQRAQPAQWAKNEPGDDGSEQREPEEAPEILHACAKDSGEARFFRADENVNDPSGKEERNQDGEQGERGGDRTAAGVVFVDMLEKLGVVADVNAAGKFLRRKRMVEERTDARMQGCPADQADGEQRKIAPKQGALVCKQKAESAEEDAGSGCGHL